MWRDTVDEDESGLLRRKGARDAVISSLRMKYFSVIIERAKIP